MQAQAKQELIEKLESKGRYRRKMLARLRIPESTYYHWRKLYLENGPSGLEKEKGGTKKVWNRLTSEEEEVVLDSARQHPELSARVLSVKITDSEEFSVSESTVYRILRKHHLIAPRPLPELPAAKEFRHKTKRPNEIWQCDATTFFVVGWGYYKLIPLLDDYSRKIIAWKLLPDESALSISSVVEEAIEKVGIANFPAEERPALLSDNGSGFISDLLSAQLAAHRIRHIFGRPYHPQTQGKIERFNRRIKEGVCLLVYCSPEELARAIGSAIETYNATPHEALENVSPNEVYAGRKEEILERRAAKKRFSLARRKIINLELGGLCRRSGKGRNLNDRKAGNSWTSPLSQGDAGKEKEE